MDIELESSKPRDFYFESYDNLPRFISYFYQIDILRKLGVNRILETGIGNKTVSNYLKNNGFDITTFDCNESLEPDVVGDIRDMPLEDGSFEAIMACEILEHLPWSDLPGIIDELYRVSSKYVVISLPVISFYFEMAIKFPMLNKIFKRNCLDLFIRLPFAVFKKSSVHHEWEIGAKGYPFRKVRKELRRKFKIIREARPVLQPKHYFFVLEKVSM